MILYNTPPKRFFAFGCSFTDYAWPTWADFVATDIGPNVEYYNLGRSGAGNQYIANTIAQADAKFEFTKDDLVMVCWTNVHREDRIYTNEQQTPEWVVPGNLTTQQVYDQEWLNRFGESQDWFFMRDLASIHLVSHLLKKTNSFQLSMLNLESSWSQYMSTDHVVDEDNIGLKAFPKETRKILPSMYKTLWGNKLSAKQENDMKTIDKYYMDYHPTPEEHYYYLKKVFKKHKWKKLTQLTSKSVNMEFIHGMKELYKQQKPIQPTIWYDLVQDHANWDVGNLKSKYFVKNSNFKSIFG